MFEYYQDRKIIIYFTNETEPYLKWAKTFWLLKTAHPIIWVPIAENYAKQININPLAWLREFLPDYAYEKALFVPVFCRPKVDIDLLQDSHQNNRYGFLKDQSPCICQMDLNASFNETSLESVFEDLSDDKQHILIQNECALIREKLHINI